MRRVQITIAGRDFVVYEDGRIWSVQYRKFVRYDIQDRARSGDRYRYVTLAGKRFRLARLMLTTFKRDPKPGEQARHWDGDSLNDHISNLRWGTAQKNWDDRKRHGRINSGRLKLTPEQVKEIRAEPSRHGYRPMLAKRYGVSTARIDQIRQGQQIQSHKGTEE